MSTSQEKTALVIIANGSEEMEAVITIDVLRRAKVKTTVAGLSGEEVVTCSRGILLKPDTSLDDAVKKGPYDVVVLPGGLEGADRFAKSSEVGNILKSQEKESRYVAGICAAPTAIATHGVFIGKKVTSYPSLSGRFNGYEYLNERVVRDGNIVTSRGPGTAMEFALEVAKMLQGEECAKQLHKEMLVA